METYRMYYGGAWHEAASGEFFESDVPYRGKPWSRVARGGRDDADRAVETAHAAFTEGEWPRMTATQRGGLMRKVGDLISERAELLAQCEVRDNGKLMAEMLGQTRYLPQWFYYYGGLADKVEGAVIPSDKPGVFNYTIPEPLGVCVAIAAWNSPLLLATWKFAPALAAGNTVIIKPSEYTSASSLEYVRLFEKAGFPPGVVNVVTGYGPEIGQALIEHPLVRKVAFTGSVPSGRHVNISAAETLKHVTLELGGKSPNIVFDDANLDNAVKGAISGIFAASGQTCIAGSRLLLQETIYEEFIERLVAFAKTARMGDPADMATQVGPITTPPQYRKTLDYIEIAKGEGAKLALGGGPARRPECGEGWFVEPTIFVDVDNRMRIAQEEVFGPVLSVIPFKDTDDALRIANDIDFGLAAGVWTRDINRAQHMARYLQAGTVWINTYRAVSVTSPFGGYKMSGLGRVNGQAVIHDYLQTKSVWVDSNDEVPNPFALR
jgi:acyl-CoA reductase-like NAD-dependent aldehyde dehydrogenase